MSSLTLQVHVERAGILESVHTVDAIAMQGDVPLAIAGHDPIAFMRSCAKPFQALPMVRRHGDLPPELIAIACASHEGEPVHVEAVRRLLEFGDLTPSDLECGCEAGRPAQPEYHQCSGNHAGILVQCRDQGVALPGYGRPDHPIHPTLLAAIAEASGLAESAILVGIDGCGIATFAMSLSRIARAYSMLGELPAGKNIVEAMIARPDLVGGTGAEDTRLMTAMPGWLAKRGVEGLLCLRGPDGVGIAVKTVDGNPRASLPAAAEFLRRLGVDVPATLLDWPLTNARGDAIGRLSVA